MPETYYFKAALPEGGMTSGELAANSEADAIGQLAKLGYKPLRLQKSAIRDSWLNREIGPIRAKKLTLADCEALCGELAILTGSGLELQQALAIILGSLTKGSRLHRFCTLVRQGLRLGRTLSASIAQSGFQTPSDLMAVVRAGENSGSLPAALTMLSDAYRDANAFGRSFRGALIYPGFLLFVALCVVAILAFFVAPNMSSLFVSMGKPIPPVIAILAGGAGFAASNAAVVAIVLLLAAFAIWFASATAAARAFWLRLAFGLPMIGPALIWSATQRFAATLRLYLITNVPIVMALPDALAAAGFPAGKRRSDVLIEKVRGGMRLSAALEATDLLPAKAVHLIRVGETSGQMASVLDAIRDEAKVNFEKRVTALTALLAPVLILAVGCLVGAIIFAVFSALLQVNELVL